MSDSLYRAFLTDTPAAGKFDRFKKLGGNEMDNLKFPKLKAKHASDLLAEAAFLVAAMSDELHGVDLGSLPTLEVRDALASLRAELTAAGYMTPYLQDGGRVGLMTWSPGQADETQGRASMPCQG
jgi:hypothetical protein